MLFFGQPVSKNISRESWLFFVYKSSKNERLHEQTNPESSPLKLALISQIQLRRKVIGINRILGIKRWPWEMWTRERNNQALRQALLGRVEAVIKSGLLAESSSEKKTILNIALNRTLKKTNDTVPDQKSIDAILANLELFCSLATTRHRQPSALLDVHFCRITQTV